MANKIHSPHDKVFRAAMADLRVAKDFFQQHLPEKIQDTVDLDTLQLSKESFIDTELQKSASDLLYAVQLNTKEPGYLYLLAEHQSTPQKLMPFRLLKYMCQIIDQHLKQNPSDDFLPVVYPLVFYNGQINYPFSMDLFGLFGKQQALVKEILLNPFQLIDISQIPDQELKKHPWAALFELMMKHIFVRDILPYLKQSFDLIRLLEQAGAEDYILTVFKYVVGTAEIRDKQLFIKTLEDELPCSLGDKTMTIAEMFKQEGLQQGLEQGILQGMQKGRMEERHELTRKLLATHIDLKFISQITELSIEEIENIKNES